MHVPWMTPNQTVAILKLLKPHHIMLEWGAGGSTILFSPFVGKYYSFEHQKDWFFAIRNELIKNKIGHNVVLHYIEAINDNFKEYVRKMEDLKDKKFDIVLIDGRRRVHCAVQALPYINEDSYVILHDAEREKYQSILKYYNLLAKVENLYILKKKNGKNKQKYN